MISSRMYVSMVYEGIAEDTNTSQLSRKMTFVFDGLFVVPNFPEVQHLFFYDYEQVGRDCITVHGELDSLPHQYHRRE